MDVDGFFRLRASSTGRARSIEADPPSIGVLSTGAACAVALLLGRPDLLDSGNHALDVLDRLGPEWEKAVRDLHSSGWRR